MAQGAAAAAIIGTGYQIYANEQATKERKKAAMDEAAAREMEAQEMLARYEINKKALAKDYAKYKGEVGLAAAKSGFDVGSAPLYLLEQVNRDYQDEQYNMKREALFRSAQAYKEGEFLRNRAKSIEKTGRLQTYGLLIQGGGQTAMALK